MRVLQVLDSFSFGGAENLVVELARLAPPGLELQAASLAPPGRGSDAMVDRMAAVGLRPQHLGVRRLLDPLGFARLVAGLRELRPDVVHAHLGYSATLVPLAARLLGIGCVATLHHTPTALPAREWLKERLSVRIPARHGLLVLVSQPSLDAFARLHGPVTDSWRLVPNGVDFDRYRPARSALVAAGRPRPGPTLPPPPLPPAADRPPTWACVAALREPKGHLNLLRAWRRLLDGGVDARLLLVGDGPHRPAIEETVARLDLGDAVALLGRRDDVPDILANVDGVVSASHTEALPTALIEAAAAGLPVVTTDAGGSTDVVTPETGWVVPVRDVAALAAALAAAVPDPDECARRGAAARARGELLFGMPTWVRRLTGLYREIFRASARRRGRKEPQ